MARILEFEGPDGKIYEFEAPSGFESGTQKTTQVIPKRPKQQEESFVEKLKGVSEKVGRVAEPLAFGLANTALLGLPEVGFRKLGIETPQGAPRTVGEFLGFFTTPTAAARGIASKIATGQIRKAALEGAVALGLPSIGPSITETERGGLPSGLARVAGQTATGAIGGVTFGSVPRVVDWLRGNPALIKRLGAEMSREGHKVVLSLRREGALNNRVFQILSQSSDEAWAPASNIARNVKTNISRDRLLSIANDLFPDDPIRVEKINKVLGAIAKEDEVSPAQLIDFSNEVGRRIRRASVKGTQARTSTDQLNSDVRSVIADAVEEVVPENLLGEFSRAKLQWSRYATDRDTLFRMFQPSAPQEALTTTGVNLLRREATGLAQPSESEFLQRLSKSLGVNLTEKMTPLARRIEQLKTRAGSKRRLGSVIEIGGIIGALDLLTGGAFRKTIGNLLDIGT